MNTNQVFENIWKQYVSLTPQAEQIQKLLSEQNEKVLNDHVAYRSVNLPGFGVDRLKQLFLTLGYVEKDQYEFEQKNLGAIHLEHSDDRVPKVFISELLLEKMSLYVQDFFETRLSNVTLDQGMEALTSGRLWGLSYEEYTKLMKESEYAAWFATFGYCANHFTVNVNALEKFEGMGDLNTYLEEQGFVLNSSGGKIKGTPEVFLEQSSTMASKKEVAFSDGVYKVPSCYYEFAKRYALPTGELYQGFVAKSADKIFESTNS